MPTATNLTSQTVGLDFSRDVLGRYLCNGFDEAARSADPNVLRPNGSRQTDARPFDVIVIGGGTLGAPGAPHVFAPDKKRRPRGPGGGAGPVCVPRHHPEKPPPGLGAAGPAPS